MRQFYLYSESWYAKFGSMLQKDETDDIFIQDDTYDGELRIVWKDIGKEKPVIQYTFFHDSLNQMMWNLNMFLALSPLPDTAAPKQVCELLKTLGFTDSTRREVYSFADTEDADLDMAYDDGYQDALKGTPTRAEGYLDEESRFEYQRGYANGSTELDPNDSENKGEYWEMEK